MWCSVCNVFDVCVFGGEVHVMCLMWLCCSLLAVFDVFFLVCILMCVMCLIVWRV